VLPGIHLAAGRRAGAPDLATQTAAALGLTDSELLRTHLDLDAAVASTPPPEDTLSRLSDFEHNEATEALTSQVEAVRGERSNGRRHEPRIA
jgi:hypothetical protein